MKLINHIQGSDDWLEWRRSKICATDISILMGMNPFSVMTWFDLWLEKLDEAPTKKINDNMRRGKEQEEAARDHFTSIIGIEVFPTCAESKEFPFAAASFDGLSKDGKTLVEIKCHTPKVYEKTLNGKIPEYYIPQLQHQLLVSELDYMYYFPFNGSHGHIIKVLRDNMFITKMLEIEEEFWHYLQTLTAPTNEYINIPSPVFS